MASSTLQRVGHKGLRTLLQAIPTAVGIVVLAFFLLKLVPGDAADMIAIQDGSATAETMEALRRQLGLDQPILTQFAAYIGNLASFDLGTSPRFNAPVSTLILERLPLTLQLMLSAFILSLGIGVTLGALAAVFQGRLVARAISALLLVLYSTPSFWISLVFIVMFSVWWNLLPPAGYETIGADLTPGAAFLDRLRHLALPALSLSLFYIAVFARLTQSVMQQVWSEDFVRTALAKGAGPSRVTFQHVLRNSLLPIVTYGGARLGGMLGGAVVIETIFSWPGLGRLAFDSALNRDINLLLGILLMSSLLVIAINAMVDILQALIDPRIGD